MEKTVTKAEVERVLDKTILEYNKIEKILNELFPSFKVGDWEVIDQYKDWVQIRSKELKLDIEWSGNECDVTIWDSNWNTCDYLSAKRIEDLPREIEFKEGVI